MVFSIIFISVTPAFASTQAVNDAAANTKLQNIYDRLGAIYQNCLVPQYTIISRNFDTSLSTINTKLYDLIQDVLAVGGQVADVSSKLLTANNYLDQIESNTDYIETHLSNINADINKINNSLDDKYLIFNSYKNQPQFWSQNCTAVWSGTDIVITNITNLPAIVGIPNLTISDNPYGWYIAKYDIDANVTFKMKSLLNGSLMPQEYSIAAARRTYIFYGQAVSGAVTGGFYITQGTFTSSSRITIKNIKYYLAPDLQIQSNIDDNIQKLTDIYASDDVIQAKQNQQSFENQAITDFTGSGNNSASVNDLGSVSNISSTVKSGLDAGGSISGGLSVFNANNSDFWGWFSQSNYNEINGISNRRSISNEYYDYVTDNQQELERLLREYD